jgi:4-amino-4-deoxy-L-arabinose transferase-like glycosyltransferase
MRAAAVELFQRRAIALVVLAILAIYGFEAHARRELMSTPASLGDQGAYLGYARQMRESNYTVIGDRNRMPVFPFLLSLIYQPGEPEAQFLKRAQTLNVNLSILLLLLLFLIFRKFFPAFYAAALLAATAFGVFLYRAVNAQTEVLFYFVSFCAFILFLQMLIAPRWWLAILCGLAMGAAHLTKASLLPALGLWVVIFAAQSLWDYRVRRDNHSGSLWRRLGLLALVLATFLAMISPYIANSKRIYGQYFYNVNSTFVMWCDSSTQAWEFLNAWGDKDKWRSLPPDQIPSLAKFWREHSVPQIAHRIVHGLMDLSTQNAMAIGYYKFIILLVLTAGILWARQRQRVRQQLAEKPFAVAFCLLFLGLYLFLYAWYDAIVNDTRFILSIFLPFVFMASIFVMAMEKDRVIAIAGRRLPFMQFIAGVVLALTVIDVVYNAVHVLV